MNLPNHPDAGIYWKQGTAAAWEIYGAIRDKWLSIGGPAGALGYPVQEEKPAFDGKGRYQHFEKGILCWHKDIPGCPFIVWGLIGKFWLESGREQFGYPLSNEIPWRAYEGGWMQPFRALQAADLPEKTIVWKPGMDAAALLVVSPLGN